MMGGSCPEPRVTRVMDEASKFWVNMFDLETNVGKILSELLGCEDGIVTSGAYAANSIATEACLVKARVKNPNLAQPEVICQSSHITKYARSFTTSGVKIREISRKAKDDDLSNLIEENTIALTYVLNESSFEFSLRETVEAGRRAGLPVIVDAAVVDPPLRGIREILEYGPDFISVSGGKGFNGPNGTGLLLGKRESISLARGVAFPNYGPGRGMKVSKEEIAGLIAAVMVSANRDEESLIKSWMNRAEIIRNKVSEIPNVKSEIIFPWPLNFPQPVPRLIFQVETADGEKKAALLRETLMRGSTAIFTRPLDTPGPGNRVVIDVRMLSDRDANRVGDIIKKAFAEILLNG